MEPNDLFIREAHLHDDAAVDTKAFPFTLPFVQALRPLQFNSRVTFFVGENGSGKSTLLEALATARGFNPEGGNPNFNFATRESHSKELASALRIVRGTNKPSTEYFLRVESFFNVSTEIERFDRCGGGPKIIDGYGGKSLHEQSHGESFYTLFSKRFGPKGVYILDEPEAALSLQR